MIVWVILAGVLLGGLGVYWWWQRAPLTPGSIPRRAPFPALMRLRRSTALGALAVVLALCLGTVYLVRAWWPKRTRTTTTQQRQAPGPPPPASGSFLDRFPAEYPQMVRAESAASPPDTSPAPGKRPASALPPRPPRQILEPPARPQPLTPPQMPAEGQTQASTAPPPAPPPHPDAWRWFSVPRKPTDNLLRAPLPDEDEDGQGGAITPASAETPGQGTSPGRRRGGSSRRHSRLFPQAVWEEPADKYKILYADQLVPCQLTTNINSDIPGLVLCKVTQAVEDRWGHGHTIIPVDTVFLGATSGKTDFGQERLPVSIGMAIFPDGKSVAWDKAQMGDEMAAAGVPASVDNHYVKLFIGVGLQALLNVGVRYAAGSPGVGQYQPTLPQEFAEQAARGINQAGQRILQQFIVKPTLTQDHGFPTTIQFGQNVSFQTKPGLVAK